MKQAEQIVLEKIETAFSGVQSSDKSIEYCSWKQIPDKWIEENEKVFFYHSHPNAYFLLPAFLCYLLRNFESTLDSQIYMNIEGTLREYSKQKKEGSFKLRLDNAQFSAIKAFIKHYLNNQPVNIDRESWSKILESWVR